MKTDIGDVIVWVLLVALVVLAAGAGIMAAIEGHERAERIYSGCIEDGRKPYECEALSRTGRR